MSDWALAGAGAAFLLVFLWAQRRWQARQIALSRIPTIGDRTVVRVLRVGQIESLWSRMLPWVLGVGSFIFFVFLTDLGLIFSFSVGFLF